MEFIEGYRALNAPKRPEKKPPTPTQPPSPTLAASHPSPAASSPEPRSVGRAQHDTLTPEPSKKKEGNGHGPRIQPDTAQPFAYGEDLPTQSQKQHAPTDHTTTPDPTPTSGVNLRSVIIADPLSQQGTEMQADAPACDVCGSITVRSGTCYKCMNCGNSMGCS
jgi:hypothetical protein